ncbi:MAG: PEP-CTERM sorting domain-containing protein [Akkermansiaceae bacterium]
MKPMKPMKNTALTLVTTATILGSVVHSSAAIAIYDWSTATASGGAGTALNSTTNGNISGANDGWYNNSTIDDVFAVNDNQPAGFSGNYATTSSGQGVRDNDGNFGYSISSTATSVTLSSVLNISSLTSLAWMGLADSTGGEQDFRIGFFSGNWVYRDNDATIVSMADTGVSAVGAVAKSYRVTAVFDLVGDTYGYTVENLSDGGSIALATGVAVDSSVAGLDWSNYDGLRIRGDDVSFDTFTVASVPEPSSTALLGLGGLALILRRRR